MQKQFNDLIVRAGNLFFLPVLMLIYLFFAPFSELSGQKTQLFGNRSEWYGKLKKWEDQAPDSVKIQIVKLRGKDAVAKGYAATTLGKMKSRASILALLENLGDNRGLESTFTMNRGPNYSHNTSVGELIKDALVDIGTDAFEPLTELRYDNDNYVAENSMKAMVEIDYPRSVDYLIKRLQKKGFTGSLAAGVLGEHKEKLAFAPLVEALNFRDQYFPASAFEALGIIGDPRAFEPLSKYLNDVHFRIDAVRGLGYLKDKRATEIIMPFLTNSDEYLRYAAIDALGIIGDPRAAKPLIALLKSNYKENHKKEEVIRAAKSLTLLNEPSVVRPILDIAEYYFLNKHILDVEVWRQEYSYQEVLKHLCSMNANISVMPLKAELNDPDTCIRYLSSAALYNICQIKSDSVVNSIKNRLSEPLINALNDKNEKIVLNSIRTLSHLKDFDAVYPLLEKLKDKNEIIRNAADTALRYIFIAHKGLGYEILDGKLISPKQLTLGCDYDSWKKWVWKEKFKTYFDPLYYLVIALFGIGLLFWLINLNSGNRKKLAWLKKLTIIALSAFIIMFILKQLYF